MEHHFDVDVAVKYGVNAAIILNNLYFWVEKAKANRTNFYDGKYWTYNSVKAFAKLFPYMSERQISTALCKLEDEGLIEKGNYNKSSYDRTTWYTLTEKAFYILGTSIMQKCKMESEEMSNGISENVEPIPDINTYINTDKKTDSTTPTGGSGAVSPQSVIDCFHSICKSYPKVRTLSDARRKAIQARLRTYGMEVIHEVFEKAEESDFLKGKNDKNWSADFDWIMADRNFAKILEGKYANRGGNQHGEGTDAADIATYKGYRLVGHTII